MNVTGWSSVLWENTASFSDGASPTMSYISIGDVTSTMTSASTPQVVGELSLSERLLLLTKEERARAEEILLVIRYVIFAISLPATVLSILVFLQPAMRSATSVYVIGLSLAQLVYIMTNIIGRLMVEFIENPSNSYVYLVYSVYVSSYLSIVVRRASYLVMCYLSLERLYAVLRPLHVKGFVLTRYPLVFTILTYIVAALLHVYMLTMSAIREVRSSRTGKMVHIFVLTDLYKENPQITDAFGVASPILMTYIPLLALMTSNIITVWALRRHNTKILHSSANEEAKRHQERQMTRTILATTVIYILLSLPYAFHNVFKSAYPEFNKRQKYQNLYYVSRSTAFTLTLLSCALDFVCFLLLSSKFRNTFFVLMRMRGDNRGKPSSMTEVTGGSSTARTDEKTKY